MKVLSIIIHMGFGGAQELLLNYLRAFRNNEKVEFKLLVIEKPRDSKYTEIIEKEKLNVEYLNISNYFQNSNWLNKIYNTILANKRIYSAIKEYKPDIVHTHLTQILQYTLLPEKICFVKKCFHTLHSNPYVYKGMDYYIACLAFRKLGITPICINNYQKQIAKDYYRVKNCKVLYNCIDINKIKTAKINYTIARKKFNLKENDFVIGAVGRWNPVKNYSFLLDIFRAILTQNSHARLLIAGGGYSKDDEKMIVDKGLKNKITVLGELSDVVPLYCALDVFVMTSLSEASPFTVLEAQVVGCKCVVSNAIPLESCCSQNVYRLSLRKSISEWVKCILQEDSYYRVLNECNINNYDISTIISQLKELYM